MCKIPELRRRIDSVKEDLAPDVSFDLLVRTIDEAASLEEIAQLRAEAHEYCHKEDPQ
jgi:hypothetical protein